MSANQIVIHKGRTNYVRVFLGYSVVADTLTCQVRSEPNVQAPLICDVVITKVGDGSTGELLLTFDDNITSQIAANSGFMDIKRVSGSEPLAAFDTPVQVLFQGTVTE